MFMQDDKQLNRILEMFYNKFNNINAKTLKMLGEIVKQFKGVSEEEAYKIAQRLKYGNDLDDLINEIAKLSGVSAREVRIVLEKVVEENFDYTYKYNKEQKKEEIKYKETPELKKVVKDNTKEIENFFKELTKEENIGFTIRNENNEYVFMPLRQVYKDVIDQAIYNAITDPNGYQVTMANAMKKLADSGIKIHEEKVEYPSGYNRRIDTTVKQNILWAIRKVSADTQDYIGEILGTDGVEISAHEPCALDHLQYQGRQFYNKEFNEIQDSLPRQIGPNGYNCKHFIFNIFIGATKPNYTKRQLRQMEKESKRKITFEGKEYTRYEATQLQRRIETEIRRQKDRQIISKASGNMEEVEKAQNKISILTRKYKELSNIANLPTYAENMHVSDYRRIKIDK